MQTFLTIVLGMFVGGILFLVVMWFGIKLLIRYFVKKLAKIFEQLGAGQGVPPFRVTLQKTNDLEWKNSKAIDGISQALEGVGYQPAGDFRFNEVFGAQMRAMVNTKVNAYAAITQVNDILFVDIVSFFADDDHVTVSNSAETGLDRPEWSRMHRLKIDLQAEPAAVVQLHERLVEEQGRRATVPATVAEFPKVFVRAYAREMDWRIARGGVTADEVRRSCECSGTEPPSDEAVAMVIQSWRIAISNFIDEQLRERFLKYVTKMSAAEWEDVRDRLYFVHEHSDRECVMATLAGSVEMDEDEDDEADNEDGMDERIGDLNNRLRPLFAGSTVRDAFMKAQVLLPEEHRYRRVASIKTPYGADVYVEPQSRDGDIDEDDE
jgi:hypothetical protein